MPLNLTPYKPVIGAEGDAAQIANGLTTIETYVNGNFEPSGIKQSGAAVGQALVWNGAAWAPATIATPAPIAYHPAPVNVGPNSAALTAIVTQVIAANTLGVNKALKCRISGDTLNNSGAGQPFRLQVVWGGVTLFDDVTAAVTAGVPRRAVLLELTLGAQDAGHAALGGYVRISAPTATTAGFGDLGAADFMNGALGGAGPAAVDSTVAQTFVVSVALAVSNPNLDFRMQYAALEVSS